MTAQRRTRLRRIAKLIAMHTMATATLSACVPQGAGSVGSNVDNHTHEIVIDGFSDSNFTRLDRSLGDSVCITGKVTVDQFHGGVYFPLRTNSDSDVIVVDLPRVVSGLDYYYAGRNGIVHGGRYRVCGALRDATPFRLCDDNSCKWYRLDNPVLTTATTRSRARLKL